MRGTSAGTAGRFGALLFMLPVTVVLAADPVPPYFSNVKATSGRGGVSAFRIAVGDLHGGGHLDFRVAPQPHPAARAVPDNHLLYRN